MNAYPGRIGLLATLCIVFSVSVFTHTAPSAPLAPPVETSSGGDNVIGEESFRAFHFFLSPAERRPDQKSYPCSPGRQFSRANSDQSMEQATTRSIRFWVQPTPHFLGTPQMAMETGWAHPVALTKKEHGILAIWWMRSRRWFQLSQT